MANLAALTTTFNQRTTATPELEPGSAPPALVGRYLLPVVTLQSHRWKPMVTKEALG